MNDFVKLHTYGQVYYVNYKRALGLSEYKKEPLNSIFYFGGENNTITVDETVDQVLTQIYKLENA